MTLSQILAALRAVVRRRPKPRPKPPSPAPRPTPAPAPKPAPIPAPAPPPMPPAPSPGEPPPGVQSQLLAAYNARRVNGLSPLAASAKLRVAAEGHAATMARTGLMEHSDIGDGDMASRLLGSGYRFRWAGENIAMGYRDVASVMLGWWNSPGHKANILNPAFTEAGFAVAYDVRGIPFWCTVLGAPAIAAPPGTYAGQLPYTVGTPEVSGMWPAVAASSVTIAAD